MTILNPGYSEGRDWGWILFVSICVGGMLLVLGVGAYSIAGSPGYETRQERFDRIEREIGDLEQRVAQLEDS